MDIPVIYEDDDVIVVDKPSGVMVHEDNVHTEPTVVDWLLKRVPDARGVGEPGRTQDGRPLERSGVVHRLDRETSGLLLLAKHQDAFMHCKAEFHDRRARKVYRAFVYGTMRERWGTIDRPIGRSARDFRLRSAQRGAKGRLRDAVTDWECIGNGQSHAYLKLMPKTGRTHQIRVHLKAVSRPVVMDRLYASENERAGDSLGFTRLALHAHELTVTLPNKATQRLIAPLPPDFEAAAERVAGAGGMW